METTTDEEQKGLEATLQDLHVDASFSRPLAALSV